MKAENKFLSWVAVFVTLGFAVFLLSTLPDDWPAPLTPPAAPDADVAAPEIVELEEITTEIPAAPQSPVLSAVEGPRPELEDCSAGIDVWYIDVFGMPTVFMPVVYLERQLQERGACYAANLEKAVGDRR